MFFAPLRSDFGESLLITTILEIPNGKTPTAGAHRGPSHQQSSEELDGTNNRQKNSMAPLDDNSVLEKGTSFRVGSWIFVSNGSGGFESCSTDQNVPEASETAKHHELDDFIDQLKEIGFSALNNETRIQSEFDTIRAKTLSELEED